MAELVGLNAQAPDAFATISKLLSIRGQQAQVQQEQQTARQRQALAKHDFNKYMGADGIMKYEAAANDPELRAAAGDMFPQILQQISIANQQSTASRDSLLKLNQGTLGSFQQFVGGLNQNPDVAQDTEKGRQIVNDALMNWAEINGDAAKNVVSTYAKQLQNVPKGQLGRAIQVAQMQAKSASDQLEAQRPSYANTGSNLRNVSPYTPGASTAATNIPLTVAPGQQDTVFPDQLGNQYRLIRDAKGNIRGVMPLAAEGGNGPARFGVGERGALEEQANKNFENVNLNRTAASMAPQQLDQINKALAISSGIKTSSWAAKRAQIESNIGTIIPGFDTAESDATKLQLLDKFAERIATDASRVLGVNARTDAERESIQKQNANIGYTQRAVQDVLKYAKAQTLAMEAKGNAQEKWLQSGGNITKQHEFETQFRKSYDPRVFQFEVMAPEEQDAYLSKLSKEDRKTLKEKTRQLMELGAISGE